MYPMSVALVAGKVSKKTSPKAGILCAAAIKLLDPQNATPELISVPFKLVVVCVVKSKTKRR